MALFLNAVCLSIDNGLKNNGKNKIRESDSSDDEFEVGLVQHHLTSFI